jgi:hypothetical protein
MNKHKLMSRLISANWVNQLQPLYIAGTVSADNQACHLQHLGLPYVWSELHTGLPSSDTSGDRSSHSVCTVEEFAVEKILLLKHLTRIL